MSKASRSSDFFVAGGTLRPNVPSYVERPADSELLSLALNGEFCYVLTPRQTGKSSLMIRTARRLRTEGVRTVVIDLTEIGLVSIDEWYLGLLTEISRSLRLSVDLQGWWAKNASLGQVQRFTNFLREVVLEEIQEKCVILIDEIDTMLNISFRDDFFAAIRAIYNARARNERLERLSFIFFGVASPSDLIKDNTRTPFNIGQGITLNDFDPTDTAVLETGLEVNHPHQGRSIFSRIFYWTNGHPYLTQKLCQTVAREVDITWTDENLDELVEELFLTKEASKESNLKFVRDSILNHPQSRQLLAAYREIYLKESIPDDPQSLIYNQLKLSGIVNAKNGTLQVRNELYRHVFSQAWIDENTERDWTRIIARIAITVATLLIVLTIGTFWYNTSRMPALAKDTSLAFYKTNDPEKRMDYLANLFQFQGLFGSPDFDYDARELFFGMSGNEQAALFEDNCRKKNKEHIIVVTKGLYTTLANVNNNDRTSWLLIKIENCLNNLGESEINSEVQLKDEVKHWYEGRELAKQGLFKDALTKYDAAIQINSENISLFFERALILNQLSNYEQALSDLDQVMAMASRNADPTPTAVIAITTSVISTAADKLLEYTPSNTPTQANAISQLNATSATFPPPGTTPTSTPTPAPVQIVSEFMTTSQVINAVRQLINSNENLIKVLVNSPNTDYPNLQDFGLIPDEQLTVTPTNATTLEFELSPTTQTTEAIATQQINNLTDSVSTNFPFEIKEQGNREFQKTNDSFVSSIIAITDADGTPIGGYKVVGTSSAGQTYQSTESSWRYDVFNGLNGYIKQGNLKFEPPGGYNDTTWVIYVADNAGNQVSAPIALTYSSDPNQKAWDFIWWSQEPTTGVVKTPTSIPINLAEPFTLTPIPEGLFGKILFKTDRSGRTELYQMDADGRNQSPLDRSQWELYTRLEQALPISSDGQNRIIARGEGQLDLWWVLPDGRELRVTSTDQPEYDAAWSPVDNHIAYVSEETGNGDIYVLNLDGSSKIRLTENTSDFDKHPTWSPDGSRIAFWSDMGFANNRQIFVVDLATREITSLSDNPFNDWDPVWVH